MRYLLLAMALLAGAVVGISIGWTFATSQNWNALAVSVATFVCGLVITVTIFAILAMIDIAVKHAARHLMATIDAHSQSSRSADADLATL